MAADPGGLHTVRANLLQKAIQHTPAWSIILLGVAASEPDIVSVIVGDASSGIPPEDLPHAFDRGAATILSRSRTTGGFGLGLSICKGIVAS